MAHDPYGQQQPQYPPQQRPPQPYPYQQPPPAFPPGYQPNAEGFLWPPQQFPREAVSIRGEMSQIEKIGWAVAIMCTCGLALPFYFARKRAARRRTVTRYR